MARILIFFASLLVLWPQAHAQQSITVYTPSLAQGQTVVAGFSTKPELVLFDQTSVSVFPYQTGWRVVIPLPLSTRVGEHTLSALINNQLVTETVVVKPKKALTINFPVPPKLNQTPKQLIKNMAVTNSGIASTVKALTQTTYISQPFGLPLLDNRHMSSLFGEVRKTGDEIITHLGTDFAARKGARIGAINAGVVSAAYLDPVYGNSVIIDHGRGIFSLYLHLDTMRVTTGNLVKKGTMLGTVGDSGLASAPHLHLSIKINGQSVDPLQFVSAFR